MIFSTRCETSETTEIKPVKCTRARQGWGGSAAATGSIFGSAPDDFSPEMGGLVQGCCLTRALVLVEAFRREAIGDGSRSFPNLSRQSCFAVSKIDYAQDSSPSSPSQGRVGRGGGSWMEFRDRKVGVFKSHPALGPTCVLLWRCLYSCATLRQEVRDTLPTKNIQQPTNSDGMPTNSD